MYLKDVYFYSHEISQEMWIFKKVDKRNQEQGC